WFPVAPGPVSARSVLTGPAPAYRPPPRLGAVRAGRAVLHGLRPRLMAGRRGPRRFLGPAPVTAAGPPALDPASLQVLISRLTGVSEEMGAVLRRSAFSPNIKERADCSAALFTPDGELLVQAEHIPVHLGSMPASVRAAI